MEKACGDRFPDSSPAALGRAAKALSTVLLGVYSDDDLFDFRERAVPMSVYTMPNTNPPRRVMCSRHILDMFGKCPRSLQVITADSMTTYETIPELVKSEETLIKQLVSEEMGTEIGDESACWGTSRGRACIAST